MPLGSLILVSASNDIGASIYSSVNTAVELAQTIPLKPIAPVRDSATTLIALIVD